MTTNTTTDTSTYDINSCIIIIVIPKKNYKPACAVKIVNSGDSDLVICTCSVTLFPSTYTNI